MKIFKLNVFGNNRDKTLAFINDAPDGVGIYRCRLAWGGRIGANYPDNARIQLLRRKPGLTLCSFIGNTQSMLIIDSAAKDLLELMCNVEMEVLKFTLYDQKNRVHSKDYWIINPVGNIDCVNRSASDIEYLNEPGDHYHGEVVGVRTFVLDKSKVDQVPNLFRVPEDRSVYFFKETLVEEIQKRNFTNFLFEEVAVA